MIKIMHTRVTADCVSIRHEYGVGIIAGGYYVLYDLPTAAVTKIKKVLFGRIVHNLKYTRVL